MLDFKMTASFLSPLGHERVKKETKNNKLLLNHEKVQGIGKTSCSFEVSWTPDASWDFLRATLNEHLISSLSCRLILKYWCL